ncbi:WecB/TagA/CpsF family glycosyltransferase [uncultured Ferrimonas sp.]|uniref:WecB/TagA/CpsF family glycosyltransferase n=1 Tax=uncultured Ferrimonas sp. TaxID=432640 RepID=UPI002621CBBF|nr:WecB/TagA/CpsF family glycosyltransferase [uncultured Ferrimonas sp.]
MRVLHVVRQFSPAMGGLENFVKSLVLEQRQQGLDAQVLTLDRIFHQNDPALPHQDTIDGIPVHRIPYRGSYKYPIAPTVLKHLSNVDLVHVHGVDFFADFLALTAIKHQRKMVLSTHGGFFHTPYASKLKQLYFHSITRLSLKAYLQVFACSNNDYQRFQPICASRLSLIENGVDTAKFADAGSPEHQATMVFIGRFSDNKRVDKLVATMAALRQHNPKAKLKVIGKDWDGNQQRLTQQIDQLQLANQVEILTGLADEQVKAQVASASYIISASEYEGFGLTLIEGMAGGLLPLASSIPSFERIISEAKLGQVVNFDDPETAAKQINGYMQQAQESYPALRQQAMQRAAVYAWPSVAQKFSQAYQQLEQRPRTLQGVTMDSRHGAAIVEALDSTIANRQPLIMAYANAHTINLARHNHDFRQLLNRCLVVNDGLGVTLASKWKYGQGFCENLNGTDFTPRYLAESQQPLRIFLLGAKPDSVQRCFDVWQQQFPQHQFVGYHHGYFDSNQAICEQIKASDANLVIVAMGNPLQEQWLDSHLADTGATLGIGVGALFDFTAGNVRRAPNWIRRINAEWLYRLVQEPKRMWRRYLLGNLTFLYNSWGDNT